MNASTFHQLISEKGNICISMFIATHRLSRERMQNATLVTKAIQKAKQILVQNNIQEDVREALQTKLALIAKNIDYIRLQEVLAIFVSENLSVVDSYPVKLKENVIVGKRFALKEIYYLAQYSQPYYLLALSKKRVPLFRCEGRLLHEIRNDDFPKVFSDDYEYAYPSLGNSTGPAIKNIEGDKSIVEEGRQIDFLKKIDKSVNKYLTDKGRLMLPEWMKSWPILNTPRIMLRTLSV